MENKIRKELLANAVKDIARQIIEAEINVKVFENALDNFNGSEEDKKKIEEEMNKTKNRYIALIKTEEIINKMK